MKIKGTIPFELTVDANNNWDLTYEDNMDNQVAIMAIAKHVLENVCAGLAVEKKNAKDTKYEKHIKAILDKGKAGHFGLELILEYMQNIYIDFKRNNPEEVDSVADTAKAADMVEKGASAQEIADKLNAKLADENSLLKIIKVDETQDN